MEGIKKLSQRDINLIGRIIDAIEDEALKLRRNSGQIMTAAEAVTLLKNHAAVGRDFEERKVSDSASTVPTKDDERKESDNGNT